MGSKQVYLLLSVALLTASMSMGFAAKQEKTRDIRAALQSLETARLQLVKNNSTMPEKKDRALVLIEKAIQEVRDGIQPRS